MTRGEFLLAAATYGIKLRGRRAMYIGEVYVGTYGQYGVTRNCIDYSFEEALDMLAAVALL